MVGGELPLQRAVGGVGGVERDGIGRVANADVVVDHVLSEAAARAVGLDADAVVGAVERKIEDANLADAAVGLAADGHAVAPVEVVVADGHVGCAAGAALDGHIVVAGADVAVGDGDVFRPVAGIDAIGVAGAGAAACRSSRPRP